MRIIYWFTTRLPTTDNKICVGKSTSILDFRVVDLFEVRR